MRNPRRTPRPASEAPTPFDSQEKVLPSQGRAHNRSVVLQNLALLGPLSRADVARSTGLTRVTVSSLVADLMDENLVVEIGMSTKSGPGKPAILLEVDTESRHVIGVDLSDLAVFQSSTLNLKCEVRARYDFPTEGATGLQAVELVVKAAKKAMSHSPRPILGVGVGTPGVVDSQGKILAAPNLGWSNLPLQQILEDRLGLPVHVTNDANAAAMAERRFGTTGDDLLLIMISGGIGAGIILGSTPRLGTSYAAGELGHVTAGTDGGPICECGKVGCLAAWLSADVLRQALSSASSPGERRDLLQEAAKRLGIVLAPIVASLNISTVSVSGPSDLVLDLFLTELGTTMRGRMPTPLHADVRIQRARVRENIVHRGVATVVIARELAVY